MQVASQVLFEQMDSRVERPVRIAGVFGRLIIVRQHSQAAHHFTEPLMFVGIIGDYTEQQISLVGAPACRTLALPDLREEQFLLIHHVVINC